MNHKDTKKAQRQSAFVSWCLCGEGIFLETFNMGTIDSPDRADCFFESVLHTHMILFF